MRTITLLLLALLILVAPASAQDDDPCYQRGGFYNDEGKCVLSMGLTIDIQMPVTPGNYYLEGQINTYLFGERARFLGDWIQYGVGESFSMPWELEIHYEEFGFGPTVIGYRFDIYTYTGGAHPNSDYHTIVVDTADERRLRLDDFFQPGVDIYPILETLISPQLYDRLGEGAFFAEGVAPFAENYEDWIPAMDGLHLYFAPYQVAPYAAGPQEVVVPWEDLAPYTNPGYVP